MTDKRLLNLLQKESDTRDQISRRACEVVRMWILRHGRAWLPIDDEDRSMALTDDRQQLLGDDSLDLAVGNLPLGVVRYRDSGHEVILADLNTYLGLQYNDRNGPGGRYYPPRPIAR